MRFPDNQLDLIVNSLALRSTTSFQVTKRLSSGTLGDLICMKKLAPLLILLLFGCSSTGDREDEHVFLQEFVTSRSFQLSRTQVPLPMSLGSACEGDVSEERWPRAKVESDLILPLDDADLAFRGLSQRLTVESSTAFEVFQYREEADSYLIAYRFELIRGKWRLVRVTDESC